VPGTSSEHGLQAQSSAPLSGVGMSSAVTLAHSPARVPQSGQNLKDEGIASPQPPHVSSGGGLGAPAGKPHSTQNRKLAGNASPQWHAQSSVGALMVAVRRGGSPVLDSPQVEQKLKSAGSVQSPCRSRFVLLQLPHVQSASGLSGGAFLHATDSICGAFSAAGLATGFDGGLAALA